RVGGERPGDAHTLLLTTGALSRITWQPGLDWAEAHELEPFGRARPDLLFAPTEDDRDCAAVVGNRVVREEAGLLDRIPDGPPQLDSGLVRDRASADPDVAAAEVDEPVDQLQGGGLAAAGGTDEADEFAGFDFEIQFVESGTG